MSAAVQSGERRLALEDILNMEDIGRAVFAANGRMVVAERLGPYEQAPNVHTLHSQSDRSALAQLYILDLAGSQTWQSLFDQDPRGGYWLGSPSPDGSKLAIYALVNDEVKAGSYDLSARRITWFAFTPNYYWLHQVPVWISNDELIYPALPQGEQPSIVFKPNLVRKLNKLWEQSFRGVENSATVLTSSRSGVKEANAFLAGALMRVNARTGDADVIADGYFYNFKLSPDHRYLALLKEGGPVQPDPHTPAAGVIDAMRTQLVIHDLRGGQGELVPCSECDVIAGTLEWSVDGGNLIFFAHGIGEGPEAGTFVRYTPATASLEPILANGLRLSCGRFMRRPQRAVAFGDRLVVFARAHEPARHRAYFSPADCERTLRYDWFLTGRDTAPINLTARFGAVFGEPVGATADAFFVLADGHVWRLEINGQARNLTQSVTGQLTLWDKGTEEATYSDEVWSLGAPLARSRAVLSNENEIIALDLVRATYTVSKKPDSAGQLVDLSPETQSALFRRDSLDGSALLLAQRSAPSRELLRVNMHLAKVAPGRETQLRYRFKDESVSSCALLPPDWKKKQRYPMIAFVYPNLQACLHTDAHKFNPYNMQLFASHGYVVLFPNTSRHLIETTEGPTDDITAAVLAAVNQAIADGHADPERLGIFGLSQGHHSALQVLTQTRRFKAAVVSHGISNFASEYGAISLPTHILSKGRYGVGNASRFESKESDNYLGVKPWENPQAYVRNSPVFYADRIDTPVLIMHSDFDAFPLGQSGEIFSALHRLRKDAVYVTYWGEGHGNLSPANIRDMWSRMLAWYKTHLR